LINHACEEADLQPGADTFAQRLPKLNPSEWSLSKSLLYKTDGFSFREALEAGVDVK